MTDAFETTIMNFRAPQLFLLALSMQRMMGMASLQDVCDSGMFKNASSDPRNLRVLVQVAHISARDII